MKYLRATNLLEETGKKASQLTGSELSLLTVKAAQAKKMLYSACNAAEVKPESPKELPETVPKKSVLVTKSTLVIPKEKVVRAEQKAEKRRLRRGPETSVRTGQPNGKPRTEAPWPSKTVGIGTIPKLDADCRLHILHSAGQIRLGIAL